MPDEETSTPVINTSQPVNQTEQFMKDHPAPQLSEKKQSHAGKAIVVIVISQSPLISSLKFSIVMTRTTPISVPEHQRANFTVPTKSYPSTIKQAQSMLQNILNN